MEKSARSAFSGSSNSSAYYNDNDNARTNCGRRNGNCGFVIGGDLDERRGKERKEKSERGGRKSETGKGGRTDRQTDRQNTEGRFVDLGRRRRRRRREKR